MNPDSGAKKEGTAIVIGGSLAGLLAARALADFYERLLGGNLRTPRALTGLSQTSGADALR